MRAYFTLTIPQRALEIRVPVLGQRIDDNELVDLVRQTGSHFFSADTMRCFRSKLYPEIRPVSNGWAFMTSEKQSGYLSGHTYARVYSVRLLEVTAADMRLRTINETDYPSLNAARKALAYYVAANLLLS
jgi:hypothetical protein